MAEDERHHQQAECRAQDHQAGDVEAARGVAGQPGQQAGAGRQQQHPDRHVDQEHRPPAAAEEVGADQHAAEDLAERHAPGQHRRVEAECPGAGGAGEGALQQAHHLGHHQRRAGALEQPEGDQPAGGRGEAAGERGGGEGGEAELEEPAVAVPGAEAGAGDEQDGVGDGVAGDDQLQGGPGGAQVGADGGDRDVDDGDVEHGHELPAQDEREEQPGPYGRGPGGACGRAGPDLKVRHGYQPGAVPVLVVRAC